MIGLDTNVVVRCLTQDEYGEPAPFEAVPGIHIASVSSFRVCVRMLRKLSAAHVVPTY